MRSVGEEEEEEKKKKKLIFINWAFCTAGSLRGIVIKRSPKSRDGSFVIG